MCDLPFVMRNDYFFDWRWSEMHRGKVFLQWPCCNLMKSCKRTTENLILVKEMQSPTRFCKFDWISANTCCPPCRHTSRYVQASQLLARKLGMTRPFLFMLQAIKVYFRGYSEWVGDVSKQRVACPTVFLLMSKRIDTCLNAALCLFGVVLNGRKF